MYCQLQLVEVKDKLNLYKCAYCKRFYESEYLPYLIKRPCVKNTESTTSESLIKKYQKALKKWKEAGKPTRSKERIAEILDICKSNKCGYYIETFLVKRCGLCRCQLNLTTIGEINKIAMATEICPYDPPKWT